MTTDPFSHDDAAYVLGALDDDERRAFEAHLATCSSCAASVASLQGMPALLAAVPRDELAEALAASPDAIAPGVDEAPPDTLLARVLREVRRRRTRRRWVLGSLAAAAAAVVIAVTGLVAYDRGSASGPASNNAVAMAAVVPAPLHATADIVTVGTGSQVDVWCTYDASGYSLGDYWLVVQARDGSTQHLATWPGVPGRTIVLRAPTTWSRADIASVEIVSASGKTLLRMTT